MTLGKAGSTGVRTKYWNFLRYFEGIRFYPCTHNDVLLRRFVTGCSLIGSGNAKNKQHYKTYNGFLRQQFTFHAEQKSMLAPKNIPKDSEITIRKAVPEDHLEIKKLSEGVYNGTDYFSHVFLHLIFSPLWKIYVAEDSEEKKLVASLSLLITDQRKFMTWRFARVLSSHRGAALCKLKSFALRDIQSVESMTDMRQRGMISKNYTKILQRVTSLANIEMCNLEVNASEARRLFCDNNVNDDGLVSFTLQDLQDCRSNLKLLRSLLPNDTLTIGSDFFRVSEIKEEESNFLDYCELRFVASTDSNNNYASGSLGSSTYTASVTRSTMTAVYWKPFQFNSSHWGVILTIYGCHHDHVSRHFSYILRKVIQKLPEETKIVLIIGFVSDENYDGMKCSEAVKQWADCLKSDLINFVYVHDYVFFETQHFKKIV